jgi:hypothetical protein
MVERAVGGMGYYTSILVFHACVIASVVHTVFLFHCYYVILAGDIIIK